MNIAQELSIVRDNIAEYGMTNITQLEYDAIYQQGRADCLKEAHRFADQESYKEGFKRGIDKGRADMKIDFIGMLEREFAIQNNPNSKFDETIVLRRRFIEKLKEQNE